MTYKEPGTVLTLLFAILILSYGPAWGLGTDWPMLGQNPSHTGSNDDETSLYPPFPFVHKFEVAPSINGMSISGDLLFVNCRTDTNALKLVNMESGAVDWTFMIPGSSGSASNVPAVQDSFVYVGGQQGTHVHCVNTRTGEEVWSHPTGSLYIRHTVPAGGKVFLNADSLYCFDGATGSVLWSRDATGSRSPTPAVAGDTLFASYAFNTLHAIDFSGNTLWAETYSVSRGPIVAGDSLLYFKSSDSVVKGVRRRDGSEKWSREFPGEEVADITNGALAHAGNTLFVSIWWDTTGNGKIYALDDQTGLDRWSHTFPDTGAITPVVANGVVYVSCWNEEVLYALNAETGEELATFPGIEEEYIVSEGNLIAIGDSDTVWVLRSDSGGLGNVDVGGPLLPRGIALAQNTPNPFNPSTTIRYELAEERSRVRLEIFDVRGRLVRTLVEDQQAAGNHSVTWDGSGSDGQTVASGVYIYRLSVTGPQGSFVETRKMVAVK